MQAARAGEPHRLLSRGLKIAPELNQFGAKRTHGGVFLGRIALWRKDRDLKAGALTREGEALAMIAACRRNQPPSRRLALDQRIHESEPATHLEGAGRQMVFMLDHGLGAKPFVQ